MLFEFSHSTLDWTALSWNFWGIFGTFLEGSVDLSFRDYIVNRRFFIYCSLATISSPRCPPPSFEGRMLDIAAGSLSPPKTEAVRQRSARPGQQRQSIHSAASTDVTGAL